MTKIIGYITALFISALVLFGCNSGSCIEGGDVLLGTLPNGATVYVSQTSFTVSNTGSTSGSISISGGDVVGESVTLSFSVIESTTPTITTNPDPCVIVTGSGQHCSIVFNPNGVAPGTYHVAVSYSYNSITDSSALAQKAHTQTAVSGTLPESIILVVTDTPPTPGAGVLTIGTLSDSGIGIGQTATAVVTLSGSSDITTPVSVTITPDNPSVATTSPTSCSLTTASNTCTVTLSAIAAGTATFTASASNYTSQTSPTLTVVNNPGTLEITDVEATTLESGYTMTANVKITGSSSGIGPVTTTVSSTDPAIMSVSPSYCVLNSGNNFTCQVTITGESEGTTTFKAAATGYTEASSPTITIIHNLFICVNDPATGNSCGCLLQNDGSNLLWYTDAGQTGIWTNWCTQSLDPSGQCTSDGANITAFNSGIGHCGYTNWHLPTMTAISEPVAHAGGNWGSIGNYAAKNGATGAAFAQWLQNQGFTAVNLGGAYWSSHGYNNQYTLSILFNEGAVSSDAPSSNLGIMLVSP